MREHSELGLRRPSKASRPRFQPPPRSRARHRRQCSTSMQQQNGRRLTRCSLCPIGIRSNEARKELPDVVATSSAGTVLRAGAFEAGLL